MTTFIYPTSTELREIERDKLPRLTANRPAFDIMPMVDLDSATLLYEQKDNITGLQQPRGLGGPPMKVNRIGAKQWGVRPGYYGEFVRIDETELTIRRPFGQFQGGVQIDDLVMEAQDQLLQRRLDRIEYTIWTVLVTGTFSALGPSGQVMHTDTFTLQTFTAGVPWATVATATPLQNLRDIQLLSRGHSVDFGSGAVLYVNRTTANNLLKNTNAADLYGRRVTGLATANSLKDINGLIVGEALPEIRIYDEGYIDDNNTFQLFIPNARGVLVGRRLSGVVIGNYQMVRNANNPDLGPGAYTKVIDSLQNSENAIPRTLDVHDGHNGGPAIFYPNAVISVTL